MCTDDIRLFTKIEKEMETLMQAVRICYRGMEMEISIEKRVMQSNRSEKNNNGKNRTAKSRKN